VNSDRSTALLTDHYELTMLDAALRSGAAELPATFEVFTRRLPHGRRVGVFAGLGRLLEALPRFRFGPDELSWLRERRAVSEATIEWLAGYRFGGRVDAYAEGEWYTQGSPVLTVEGTFGEAVLLETLILSILNHDSAVAAAASLIVGAAGSRPIIEMGSRRTDPDAAIASARAAYLSGFASTSNLEAGRRYGIPTAGTAAHAFILVHDSERAAFAAQIAAFGPGTTLLVDTFDVEEGIRTAVEVAGPSLGAVRIDSGDLVPTVHRARKLLDELGAPTTRIIVTGDLDDRVLRKLADAPADGYGVGTNVVTGLGVPTAGFVYKLVAVGDRIGGQHSVAKLSPGKASVGGRKWAWRVRGEFAPGDIEDPLELEDSRDTGLPSAGPTSAGPTSRAVLADVVTLEPGADTAGARRLQRRVVEEGEVVEESDLHQARSWHARVRRELHADESLVLVRRP
jgi:nicotinate phosphoribosyltransferase